MQRELGIPQEMDTVYKMVKVIPGDTSKKLFLEQLSRCPCWDALSLLEQGFVFHTPTPTPGGSVTFSLRLI